jgi:hypothetical protein
MRSSDAQELITFLRTMADELEKEKDVKVDVAQAKQETLF